MMPDKNHARRGQRLVEAGVLLFLIGLIIGLAVPAFENPRMGLSSHLESLFNGLFLMVVGLFWGRIALSERWKQVLFWLLIYGTFANMTATLLAAIWGAGEMMPIAGQGMIGSTIQELVIAFLLVTLALAMIAATIMILVGLRKGIGKG